MLRPVVRDVSFEQLQKNTKVHQQPLLAPLHIEASAAQEATILHHLPTFEAQGFQLRYLPEEPPGRRLQLLSTPFSRNQTFGAEDVLELASMLADGLGGHAVEERQSKLYLTLKNGRSASSHGDTVRSARMSCLRSSLEVVSAGSSDSGRLAKAHVCLCIKGMQKRSDDWHSPACDGDAANRVSATVH